MVGSNKILTVSYGTFSCTLEGFDDSFGTMKAIAEYFRDLAADDRYFGAEPPTPDAEMLARIAEREVARRVEARLDAAGTGIVLRVDNTVNGALGQDRVAEAAPAPGMPHVAPAAEAPQAAPVAEIRAPAMPPAPTFMEAPRPPVANDSVAAKLARIRAVVGKAAASSLEEEEPGRAAAPIEDAQPSAEPFAEAPPAALIVEPEPVVASAPAVAPVAAEPEPTAEAVAEPIAEAVAPEIRATASAEPEASIEEGPKPTAETFTDATADGPHEEPTVEAMSPVVAETAPELVAVEPESVELVAEEPVAVEPVAEEPKDAAPVEAAAGPVDAVAAEDQPESGPVEAPVAAPEPEAVQAEPSDSAAAAAQSAVPRPRVIRMRRTDFDEAMASGLVGAEAMVEAVAPVVEEVPVEAPVLVAGPLPPDVEADLQAELAAIEAEARRGDAEPMTEASAEPEPHDEADAAFAVAGLMASVSRDEPADDEDAGVAVQTLVADEDDLEAALAASVADVVAVEDEAPAAAEPELEQPTLDAWDAQPVDEVQAEPVVAAVVMTAGETAAVEADVSAEVLAVEADVEAEVVDLAEAVAFDAEAEVVEVEAIEPDWNEPAAVEADPVEADATVEQPAAEAPSEEDLESVLAAMRADSDANAWTSAPVAEAPDAEEAILLADEVAADEVVAEELVAETPVVLEPETPAPVTRRAGPEGDEEAVARLLSRADAQLAEPEMSRRREAIAQLRAAVAATEAARRLGEEMPSAERRADPFREDLRQAVRPRRPVMAAHPTERPRPAPLKLVASQRVDLPEARPDALAAPLQPIRPRRVTVEAAAPEPAPRVEAGLDGAQGRSSFQAFAAEMGATSLTDILEAAAAYTAFVEGAEDFSRPQIIDRVRQVAPTAFSREDGLRSFGTLLRQGTITRVRGGRFQVTGDSRFNPSRRAS